MWRSFGEAARDHHQGSVFGEEPDALEAKAHLARREREREAAVLAGQLLRALREHGDRRVAERLAVVAEDDLAGDRGTLCAGRAQRRAGTSEDEEQATHYLLRLRNVRSR